MGRVKQDDNKKSRVVGICIVRKIYDNKVPVGFEPTVVKLCRLLHWTTLPRYQYLFSIGKRG